VVEQWLRERFDLARIFRPPDPTKLAKIEAPAKDFRARSGLKPKETEP
jgi:hypothetical protein